MPQKKHTHAVSINGNSFRFHSDHTTPEYIAEHAVLNAIPRHQELGFELPTHYQPCVLNVEVYEIDKDSTIKIPEGCIYKGVVEINVYPSINVLDNELEEPNGAEKV